MRLIIKAGSLRGACALIEAQGFKCIAYAVRRDGVWEVMPC